MKRTPWFHTDVLPTHEGTYEWQCDIVSRRTQKALFSEGKWRTSTIYAPNPFCSDCQWRGLLRPAKEQQK